MKGSIIPDVIGKSPDPIVMTIDETVLAAAKLMQEANISALMIIDNKDLLVGIVSERDITRKVTAAQLDPATTKLEAIMTKKPFCIRGEDPSIKALEIMRKHNIRHLPVAAKGKPIAMVSIRDLYACVYKQMEEDLRQREDFIFGSGYGG